MVGRWPGYERGSAVDIAIAGDYAYVADSYTGLFVLDLTDPAGPVRVGEYRSERSSAVAVAGRHAYLAHSTVSLVVLDVGQPTAPSRVGECLVGGFLSDIALAGDHVYIANQSAGLQVVDVRDVQNPARVGACSTVGSASAVVVAGGHAYVAASGGGLQIIDIGNPTAPVRVGNFLTSKPAEAVAVAGHYAIVASGDSMLRDVAEVLDVSNPTNPIRIGAYNGKGINNLKVTNDYGYLASGLDGLEIIDLRNPSQPVRVAALDTVGYAVDVTMKGRYACVAEGRGGVRVVDVGEPPTPVTVGWHDTRGRTMGVAVSGHYAYLADEDAGMQVIDVSNPSTPVRVGHQDLPGWASDLALSGAHAYVAAGGAGMHVVDISDPSSPVRVGGYETRGMAASVALWGQYAVVAGGEGGLHILDVSDPHNPQLAGSYESGGNLTSVAFSGRFAYVMDVGHFFLPKPAGLWVLDISNPQSPLRIGAYDLSSAPDVAVVGNSAFVAVADYGLMALDITNPTRPTRKGELGGMMSARSVTVAGHLAYVAGLYQGVHVVDVSDPMRPTRVGTFNTDGDAQNVVVAGNYAYVADQQGGLVVLGLDALVNPAPEITEHPQSQALLAGQMANLHVSVTGVGPFTHQWYVGNGGNRSQPIPGAITEAYTTPPVWTTTSYWVLVSTALGSVASDAASVAVMRPPAITQQPTDQSLSSGRKATLGVTAAGDPPLLYQWYVGASGDTTSPILGATTATYTSSPLAATAAYWVRVSNLAGATASRTATVTVRPLAFPPQITQHPLSQDIAREASAVLMVSATGDSPLMYQWYVGQRGDTGTPVAGATEVQYRTPPLTATTAYWVRIHNASGSVDSETAIVSVGETGPYAGHSHAHWVEAWTRWMLSLPADARHPLLEPVGLTQATGQSGPVWFLTGPRGATNHPVRHSMIPEGKTILVPLAYWFDLAHLPGNPASEDELRSRAASFEPGEVTCLLDGVAVPNLDLCRVRTDLYTEVETVANNLLGAPAGRHGPGLTEGVFVPIPPPNPGRHTLTVSSKIPGQATAGRLTNEIEIVRTEPELSIAIEPAQPYRARLSWPVGHRQTLIESRDDVAAGPWTTLSSPLVTNGSLVNTEVGLNLPLQVFRLRRPAGAGLAVHEPFDLIRPNDASLDGNGGGIGFSGSWSGSGCMVATQSLGGVSVKVSGGSAYSLDGSARRSLRRALRSGPNEPDAWFLSVCLRPEAGDVKSTYFGLELGDMFLGKPGNGAPAQWVLEKYGGAEQVTTGRDIQPDRTDLLVLKMDFRSPRRAFLWMNPPPGNFPPAIPDAIHAGIPSGLERIGIVFSGRRCSVDEIRIGESYGDVTPTE